MNRLAPALLIPLALAACSGLSRGARIEAKLEKAGLKPGLARCMAHKLDAQLSDAELARLADAAKTPASTDDDGSSRHHHHHGLGELAGRLAGIGDPHITDVVTRAGVGCTILG